MTAPRYVVPNKVYLLTRRTLERRYFMRPDARTNAIIAYLVAVAAARYGIGIVAFVFMSNHYHIVLYDPHGKHPLFTQYLNSLIGRAMNCLRRRTDSFWDGKGPNIPELVDAEAVIDRIGYVLTNPSKDGMVPNSRDWPGLRSTPQVYTGEPKTLRRPNIFFDADGDMPETIELCYVIPASHAHLTPEEFGQLVAEKVQEKDAEARAKAAAEGRTFLGVRGIKQTRWYDRAKTPEPHGPKEVRRPSVIARCRKARRAAVKHLLNYRQAYRVALDQFASGDRDVVFPAGTWKRRVELNVRCHDPP